MTDVSIARLKEVLDWDQDTGIFRWKVSTSNRVRVGAIAGHIIHGYRVISVDGKKYRAHHIVWLFSTGAWPIGEVDHIYGKRSDNRFGLLRDVTGAVNRQNVRIARSHNKSSGVLGVDRLPGGSFRARIQNCGKTIYLGVFSTAEQAHNRYVTAKRELHEGCTL
jgi:hypothetical protein